MFLAAWVLLLVDHHRLANSIIMRRLYPSFGGEMAVPVVHSHLHQALMVSISIWPLHDHRRFDVVWLCDKVLVLHFPVHG